MASPLVQAIQQICDEKHIAYEVVMETIEAALAAAYRKDFGLPNQNIKVEFDPETLGIRAFDVKTVVEDQELPSEEELAAIEAAAAERAKQNLPEEPELDEEGNPIKRFNPKTEMMLSEARRIKSDVELGETLRLEVPVLGSFGRMAAQTAKQVITQKLREAERDNIFGEFKGHEGEIVNATIQRREGRMVLVDLGRTTAIMPPEEQIPNENYQPGMRLKVFIAAVNMTSRGPAVIVSRAHPDIIRQLFQTEIPECAAGSVKVRAVAREAGSRTKVAVSSDDPNVDPIGSCIGQRGTRIQTIISELGGEKIDVILYDEDPVAFITKALAPAKIREVKVDETTNTAEVFADADQLSLAIGKLGQNVRLASRLTAWRINIHEAGVTKPEEPAVEVKPTEEAPKEEQA